MASTDNRLRSLFEAGVALSSELSLDTLLQKLVETAAELTGARYVAMGVIDLTGVALERFVTHGFEEETHAAIGDLPRGRGILGVLISDAQPLRLHELADDPRSVGFPPHHPPMRTFLGVPVLLRGVAYGNLYLTEKGGGGDFTDEDEELVTERLRELIDARAVAIGLPQPDGSIRIEAASGEQMAGVVLGPESKSVRVLERRRSERVDSVLDDPEVDHDFARRFDARAAIWVPLLVRDRAIGLLFAIDKRGADPRFGDDDLRVAESFASRAAGAVDLSERVARDSVRRVVAAQEQERARLALELHDETGQALTSILLGLKGIEGDPSLERIAGLRELVVETLRNVRQLAVDLRPSALDDFGLEPALRRLAENFTEQATLDVDLVVEDDGRGFEPNDAHGDSLGIVGMRERVGLLRGRFAIESQPGKGATITVQVPL